MCQQSHIVPIICHRCCWHRRQIFYLHHWDQWQICCLYHWHQWQICHQYQQHPQVLMAKFAAGVAETTCVVDISGVPWLVNISANLKKIKMILIIFPRAWGKMIQEKISCHRPFTNTLLKESKSGVKRHVPKTVVYKWALPFFIYSMVGGDECLGVPQHDGRDGVILAGDGEPRPRHRLPEPQHNQHFKPKRKVERQVKALIKHLAIFFLLPSMKFLPISFKIQLLETSPQKQKEQRQKQLDVSFFWCLVPSCTFWILCIFSYCLQFAMFVCLLKRLYGRDWNRKMAEKSSWDKAKNIRQKLGLAWRDRKKISQIIKDYFYIPFFLLIILWFKQSLRCN